MPTTPVPPPPKPLRIVHGRRSPVLGGTVVATALGIVIAGIVAGIAVAVAAGVAVAYLGTTLVWPRRQITQINPADRHIDLASVRVPFEAALGVWLVKRWRRFGDFARVEWRPADAEPADTTATDDAEAPSAEAEAGAGAVLWWHVHLVLRPGAFSAAMAAATEWNFRSEAVAEHDEQPAADAIASWRTAFPLALNPPSSSDSTAAAAPTPLTGEAHLVLETRDGAHAHRIATAMAQPLGVPILTASASPPASFSGE